MSTTCPRCGEKIYGTDFPCPEYLKGVVLQEAREIDETEASGVNDLLPEPVQWKPASKANLSAITGGTAGERWGNYELLEPIGRGVMGTVFKARHARLNRLVALKIIKLGMDTKSVIARFEAERQALAMMDHPNIVTNLGPTALDAGDRFKLVSAGAYAGSFSTIKLPPLNSGLGWTNKLLLDGSIEAVNVSLSQPKVASITTSGGNVIISGTNGTPGASSAVLTATNVTLPASNWLSLTTNQFDASGNFAFTNPHRTRRTATLLSPPHTLNSSFFTLEANAGKIMKTQLSKFAPRTITVVLHSKMLTRREDVPEARLVPSHVASLHWHTRHALADSRRARRPQVRTLRAPFWLWFGRVAVALAWCASVLAANAASFITASPLKTSRAYHTATLLLSGKVLVVGGYTTNSVTGTAELYDPVTGTWTATGSLITGRREHTATLLPNGGVLAVGGYDSNNTVLTSAELYDPGTGNWTAAGDMSVRRYQHSATLLRSGKLLISGGSSFGTYLATAELYDPATGSWTNSGRMNASHTLHTATLMPDGKVLVAGGFGTNQSSPVTAIGLTTCELYDPVSGTWTNTGSLAAARWYHMATLLPNGKVLVASGFAGSGGGFRTSAELYDPASGTWTNTGPLGIGRSEATATLLPNGTAIVIGGYNNPNTLTNAEVYNPSGGTWTAPYKLNTRRFAHTATLMPNGRILVAGGDIGTGFSTNSVEVFDLDDGTWAATTSMNVQRYAHSATLLPNGKVLVAGGLTQFNGNATNRAEMFDPAAATWGNTGAMTTNRAAHTATLLSDGRVLVAGGEDSGLNPISTAELYNPATGAWTNTGGMNLARWGHTATLLHNGKVLVAAGIYDFSAHITNSAELYDPITGTWTLTGSLTDPRYGHTAVLLPSGKVLVAGGSGRDFNGVPTALSSAQLYDPATGTWANTGPLNTPREFHSATLLQDGRVIAAGGFRNPTFLASSELYFPASGSWTNTGSMNDFRNYHTATLLPNGKVLVAGGLTTSGGTLSGADLYDPARGLWTRTGFMTTNRGLHTATLLPNGKVLIAGSRRGVDVLATTELYDVGLGFSTSRRPVISNATTVVSLGGSLTLTGSKFRGDSGGSGGNTSHDSPADYPLVQLRSLDSGQTAFLGATSWSTNSFISAPVTGLPPDWALATVFVNGIPSVSSLFRLDVPLSNLSNPVKLAGGAFRFNFTNVPGAKFTALTANDIAAALNTWTVLGGVAEIASGQYQFTDSVNTNNAQRFYIVRRP